MKANRWLIAALLGVVTLLAAATPGWAKLNVFACEPEWAGLAQELGRDYVTVYSATTALQDPHQIQAKPSLIARLRNSDLMVCTGAELEIGWLPVLLLQSTNSRVQVGAPGHFFAADHVRLVEVPTVVDRAQGDIHAQGNPHIQTSALTYPLVAKALAARLAAVDPPNAAQYQANLTDFLKRWSEATRRWEAEATPLRGVPVLVHHQGWTYLLAWLGLQEVGALEPKPGVPPSAQHLNDLLARLRTEPAKMVIRSPIDDPRASEFIVDRVKTPQVVLPGTIGGTTQAKDLFTLFDDIVRRLLQGLSGNPALALNQRG
jgi:zinc/manganese transport system substrate-binding protein